MHLARSIRQDAKPQKVLRDGGTGTHFAEPEKLTARNGPCAHY